jgi:hypothetical protein
MFGWIKKLFGREGPPRRDEPGRKTCPTCNGNRKCPSCGGKGCSKCNQRGECWMCHGSGEIPVK